MNKPIYKSGGWMDGWMGGCKSGYKDCLQQLKTQFIINKYKSIKINVSSIDGAVANKPNFSHNKSAKLLVEWRYALLSKFKKLTHGLSMRYESNFMISRILIF